MTRKAATMAKTPEEMIKELLDEGWTWAEVTSKMNQALKTTYTTGTVIAMAHRSGVISKLPEYRYERYSLPANPNGMVDELEQFYLKLTDFREMANYQALKTKSEWVHVFAVGDIHLGHRLCDYARARKYLEYIEQAPDTYCFLMGDLLECAQKNSIGKSKDEEILNASEQWDLAVKIFRPLVRAKKILWGHMGNHEGRIAKNASFELMEKLLNDVMGIPYLDYEGYTVLRVNDIDYVFYTHHGWGGARTKAGKMKKLDEMSYYHEADIYGMGHTHELFQGFSNQRYVDLDTMEIRVRKRPIMLTGSFLKYGGYVSMKQYPPNSIGAAKVELNAQRKKTFIRE